MRAEYHREHIHSIAFAAVIIIAFVLRIALLSSIPNGFLADEVSNGYDAYAIVNTLRDRYGVFLPTFVRGLDDYREALYIYMMTPIIKIFGLSETTVRLTSAFIGTFTVVTFYFFIVECFDKTTALVSAFMLAASPWHIQFSRIGFRAILVPLLFCVGLFFFFKSLKKPLWIIPSGLFFGMSLYTYPTARVFVPLFLLALTAIFWNHLWNIRVYTLMSAAIFTCIFIPLFLYWITPEGMARAHSLGIIFDPGRVILNYISYFSPEFLFLTGDPMEKHGTQHLGELYLFEIVTVTAGIYFVIRERSHRSKVLLVWLLLYPVPAVLISPLHALRSIIGAPLFAILSGIGLVRLPQLFRVSRQNYMLVVICFFLYSFSNFIYFYFIRYPEGSYYSEWKYGMRQAFDYVEKYQDRCIIYSKDIPGAYIFISFFKSYLPENNLSPFGKSPPEHEVGRVDKFIVKSLSNLDISDKKCTLVVSPEESNKLIGMHEGWRKIHVISDPLSKEFFVILENDRYAADRQ